MKLEDDLRTTLTERATEPAVRPDLLEQVRGGIRRSRRRRAAVLGAAALLVAAIAAPVVITQGPSPVPVPLLPGPADPAAGWEQPRLDPPAFPLTPGWTPPGAGQPRVGQAGPSMLLSYEHGPTAYLQVEVGPKPGDWEAEGDGADRSTTVSGRPAKVRTVAPGVYQGVDPGDRYVGVRWRLADGRWVQLLSTGGTTETDVLRFARGLRLQAMPASPLPFAVATAPAGLRVQALAEWRLCLAPPALVAEKGGRGICLSVIPVSEGEGPEEEDERLTVRGRPATLASNDEGPMRLTVPLEPERALTIDVTQEDVPLTREQLIRFAEGVTVGG
jgi:hypothetical protein